MADTKMTTTPPDLFKRMEGWEKEQDKVIKKAMDASLIEIQKAVPPYAKELPNQRYVRTGRLGSSMGISMSGQPSGFPDIHKVTKLGEGQYEAVYGSHLHYSEDVIGEGKQKPAFSGRWWTDETVANRAVKGTGNVFVKVGVHMVNWLNARGVT